MSNFIQKKQPSKSKRKQKNVPRLAPESLELRMMLTAVQAFDGEAGLYQVYSNYGQTGEVDPSQGSFANTESRVGERINAVGFRAEDNFAYGILSGSFELARVGADGSHESLGPVDGLPTNQRSYFVGDFANDDLLWIRNAGEMNKLYGINVDTVSVERTITTSAKMTNIYDIAFNPVDEKFYASRRGPENTLISISMDGEVKSIGENGLQLLTFGAMYADAEGSVFGGANQTGDVYRFNTETGEATWVAQGPASGVNDGFSNSEKILELAPTALDDYFESTSVRTVTGNVLSDNSLGSDVDGNDDSIRVIGVEGTSKIGREVVLESGASVILKQDGSFEYESNGKFDHLVSGQTATDRFVYTISDDTGLTDTAIATVSVEGIDRANGFEGVTVRGLEEYGIKNEDVVLTNVGDVNGDGYDDAAVAVTNAASSAGATFLIYGSADGIDSEFNVQDLCGDDADGSLGSVFYGENNDDRAGRSISAAGDLNGDGIADMIIGASDADPNGVKNAGKSYVVFGSTEGYEACVNLADIVEGGAQGFAINGINAHDLSGSLVASIGDINNDGFADVAIGASQADVRDMKNAGQTYIVYGTDQVYENGLDLADLLTENGGDGSRGFVLNGAHKHDWSGTHVEGRADLNGDGIADILITSPNSNADGLTNSGQSYVVFGNSEGFEAEFELAQLRKANGNDGTRGFCISGSTRQTRDGGEVKIADDLNGDGIADLVVGMGSEKGSTRSIIYGKRECPPEVRLVSLIETQVYLDNFDVGNKDFDSRDWDQYTHSATLHSSEGNSVTIWGDPHVVIVIDGVTERFDIGYGEGAIEIDEGTIITWASKPHDADNPEEQFLPLDWFSVDTTGNDFDRTIDADDDEDVVDALTGMTDDQLRDLAIQLRQYAGSATAPLERV